MKRHGLPPSRRCREIARAIGAALGRRPWLAQRENGWRIYCRYQGEPLDGPATDAVNHAIRGTRWGSRCSISATTVRLTVWVDLPADEEPLPWLASSRGR
ncbi:hypothetical protein P3T39_003126 [Kitasatospora sp. GP82]|nr:hypothetical protein [Kitasatospora sp. GP82]